MPFQSHLRRIFVKRAPKARMLKAPLQAGLSRGARVSDSWAVIPAFSGKPMEQFIVFIREGHIRQGETDGIWLFCAQSDILPSANHTSERPGRHSASMWDRNGRKATKKETPSADTHRSALWATFYREATNFLSRKNSPSSFCVFLKSRYPESFFAMTTKSYPWGKKGLLSLKNSLISRLTLFLAIAFPTLLLTLTPSLLICNPLCLAMTIKCFA